MEPLIWGVLAGFFLIIEALKPALVSLWFAIGAFVAMFLSFFVKNTVINVLVFSIISFILVFFIRKIFSKDDTKASNIGDSVIVIKRNKNKHYEVKYKGTMWAALSNDEFIEGDSAVISGYLGNKMLIKKEKLVCLK